MTVLLAGFGPALFVLCAMWIPVALTVATAGPQSSGAGFDSRLPDLVVLVSIGVVPVICAILCSLAAGRARTWLARFMAIYIGLQSSGLAIAFIISASIAGVSMAVAEGVASGWGLKLEELRFAIVLLAPMQVVILPWAVVVSLILQRFAAGSRDTDRVKAT